MTTDKSCPLRPGFVCGPLCGFYLESEGRCSINVLAESLLKLVHMRGKIFSAKMRSQGRITMPRDVREGMGIGEGDWVRVLVAKRTEGSGGGG